jgi:predicted Zn-dependent protease
VGGVALLGLGGAYAAGLVGPARAPEFDYGPKRALVVHQREQLEREPCNRTRASEYTQTLASLQDWEGALATVDGFVAKCGAFPQLRSLSYAARMRQKDYALALRDADELVRAAPTNASYLVWRAQAHEAAQALEPALADFERAFALKPGQRQVAGLLAQAYAKRERRCEALRVLQRHVQETPASAQEPALREQMGQLESGGECPAPEAAPTAP